VKSVVGEFSSGVSITEVLSEILEPLFTSPPRSDDTGSPYSDSACWVHDQDT